MSPQTKLSPIRLPLQATLVSLVLFLATRSIFLSFERHLAGWVGFWVGGMPVILFLALLYSRQKKEALYRDHDYSLTGILKVHHSGKIAYANRSAAQIVDLGAPEDLVKSNWKSYLLRADSLQEWIGKLASEGEIRAQEMEIRTARGRVRNVLCSAFPTQGMINLNLVDITDRIQMGVEFRKLSRIVAQMPDMVVITDIDGRIEYVNPAFEQMTGYSREEALGQTPRILKSGVHPQEFYAKLWDTIRAGGVFREEITNRKKTGELYYQTQTITPIRNAQRKITNFVVTGKDNTVGKLAMGMLQKSQANLEMAQSIARLGSWEIDYANNSRYWSREMIRLFHLEPDVDPPGPSEFLKLVHADDRRLVSESYRHAVESGRLTTVEYRANPSGAEWQDFQATFQAARDSLGNLQSVSGTVLNITDIKTAQRKLEALNSELEKRVEERTAEVRQNEAVFQVLFENSNDGIFLISPRGQVLRANRRAHDLLRRPAEEARGAEAGHKRGESLPELLRDVDAMLQAVSRGEPVPSYERSFLHPDGRRIAVEISLSAVRNAPGDIHLVQSVVRDITERKKAEEILRESHDRLHAANLALEKASKLKDEFLASMSHELRTPLTSILGIAESLEMQVHGPLNEKQFQSLKAIETSGWHLLDLINDILDLSKIEAGKLELHTEEVEIEEVCLASQQLVKGMARQKKQNIQFEMQPESISMVVDARRLKQMLVNLLGNAVKFTPEGGAVGLQVRGDPEGCAVHFTVWDKGIGIQLEKIGELFKPFVQLDSSLSRQYSGTGLGLSLVRRMAELHGGSIQVESAPGQGSRFTILLPWLPPGATGAPDLKPRRSPASSRSAVLPAERNKEAGIKPLLLVTDDNEQILAMLSDFLEANNYRVVTARSGYELLIRAPELRPDVILVDVQMPGMDGLEAIRRLRAQPDSGVAATPMIAVTAQAMPEDRENCYLAGANDYLSKPVHLNALLETIGLQLRPARPPEVAPNP